ncbi:DUF2892 domain-containing protein [Marivivens donghaensis]|uniref:DUF2892 domain-containing protein n=1 Tax=Marivivens donghaensis TaxID=1699413 RepID=A0ABX0VZW1_9RHOB|nr:DUF2892 domain-containing protein [Marivivens donghaensis]NIY72707.1 DUF2892 domain-containing protein [Marivivens donghaensis]
MFSQNEGKTDRMIRVVVGLILIGLFFAGTVGAFGWVLLIVGIVLLVTGALGTCPAYSLLGINTCKVK